MAGPILRATDSTGEIYDDPSEDALFMFMEDLEPVRCFGSNASKKDGGETGLRWR